MKPIAVSQQPKVGNVSIDPAKDQTRVSTSFAAPARWNPSVRSARAVCLLLMALLTVTCGSRAVAQAVANAQIHGLVHDSSGAVVPCATIVATQTETVHIQTVTSGEDGAYLLADLPVGV